jgi:peroxiredoxin
MRGFLTFSFALFTLISLAQPKLTENSIVKDSTGLVYPSPIWKALLQKGFSLKMVDPKDPNTEFIIYKMSEKQWSEKLDKMSKPRESTTFKTGDKFKGFKTTDINGNKIDLKSMEGKIIVLNFWFINCPPCRSEIGELNHLVDSFKSNDKVIFIAVALDTKSQLQEFLESTPFKYTIIDNGRFIADQFGVKAYPTHVIVNPDKKVYFHTMGLAPNTVYWLKKSIRELLTKKEPTTTASN